MDAVDPATAVLSELRILTVTPGIPLPPESVTKAVMGSAELTLIFRLVMRPVTLVAMTAAGL